MIKFKIKMHVESQRSKKRSTIELEPSFLTLDLVAIYLNLNQWKRRYLLAEVVMIKETGEEVFIKHVERPEGNRAASKATI